MEQSVRTPASPFQIDPVHILSRRRPQGSYYSFTVFFKFGVPFVTVYRTPVHQAPPWQMQFAFGGPFGMMTSLFGFHAHVGHFPMAYRGDAFPNMGINRPNERRDEPDAQTALAHALLLLGLLLLLLVAAF